MRTPHIPLRVWNRFPINFGIIDDLKGIQSEGIERPGDGKPVKLTYEPKCTRPDSPNEVFVRHSCD